MERSNPGGGADPFLRGPIPVRRGSRTVHYLAPHSVFSSHAVDRGTSLLLENLPSGEPQSFLDLGCGYGLLGLEAAARFPGARGLLVDRDLLAVEYSRLNAERLGIAGVSVIASLGYRDLIVQEPEGRLERFDWILANVPARAGERAMEAFIAGGLARLRTGGEVRIVVIAPLAPAVIELARARSWRCEVAADSRQHRVLSFPFTEEPAGGATTPTDLGDEAYVRDRIQLALPEKLELTRPTDLADEPHRLRDAIPLLADRLEIPSGPGGAGARILVFRCGYGLVPALALARSSESRVLAVDRDLLAVAFTRKNTSPWKGRIETRPCLRLGELEALAPFDLILGELSPPLGERATQRELEEAKALLAPGGRALVLGLHKQSREAIAAGMSVLASRGEADLFGMVRPAKE